MYQISFKPLDWEHLVIIYLCSIIAVFAFLLSILFLKKYKKTNQKPILLLFLFAIFSLSGLIFYILEDVISGNISEIFQSLYMISFVFMPFLLLRFMNTIFSTESNKYFEYILFGAVAVVVFFASLYPELDYLEDIGLVIVLIALINIFVSMIIKPLKMIPKIDRNERIIVIRLKMIVVAAILFFGFVFLILTYDYVKTLEIPYFGIIWKLIAFTFFTFFQFIVYIGFYVPKFYRNRLGISEN